MTSTLLTEKVDNLSPNKNQGELWVVNNPKRAFWVVNNPQKLPRDIQKEFESYDEQLAALGLEDAGVQANADHTAIEILLDRKNFLDPASHLTAQQPEN